MNKRLITIAMFILAAATMWADVDINDVNFPDANFRKYLLSQTYGKDGNLKNSEITSIKRLSIEGLGIQSLKGIEYFTALTSLNCLDNQLDVLDVSKNTKLKDLQCGKNQLTALDVSQNTSLTGLYCGDNLLTTLEVSQNTRLTGLGCPNNKLTSLDVSQNTNLEYLDCSDNQLTTLDVSNNRVLKYYLYCSNNQLTTLSLANNYALEYLSCSGNKLTSLDISHNAALKGLECAANQLSYIDVSNNSSLSNLDCSNNKLTSLDLSRNMNLDNLYFYQNQIKGAGMDALITSLPVRTGSMRVIYYEGELNEMTSVQVDVARQKGWTSWYSTGWVYEVEHDFLHDIWKEYTGSEASSVKAVEQQTDYADYYFNLNGRRYDGKPQERGIYIVKGKKRIIK